MDAAIALTVDGERRHGDARRTATGRRARSRRRRSSARRYRSTGARPGSQLGIVTAINVTVDVCYLPLGDFCLAGQARFVNQFSIPPGRPSVPRATRARSSSRKAATSPSACSSQVATASTIAQPDRRRAAAVRRHDRRRAADRRARPPPPPASPLSPATAASTLSWTAPAFDGGSPVTDYKVYRGTSPDPTSASSPTLGTSTSFVDSGLANGTTYYYKVSAANANGEGPLSNEASATPDRPRPARRAAADRRRLQPREREPALRCGALDERRQRLGRDRPLRRLATRSPARRRRPAPPGATTRSTARTSKSGRGSPTLPGSEQPDPPATRACNRWAPRPTTATCCDTNQLAGTDQILLERVDNGVIVNRLTVNQELAAGDVLLLRVKGSTFEAWRHDGSAWSRLGTSPTRPTPPPATSASACAGRPAVSTTSARARLAPWPLRPAPPPASPPSPATAPPPSPGRLPPSTAARRSPATASTEERARTRPAHSLADARRRDELRGLGLVNGTTYYYKVSAAERERRGPALERSLCDARPTSSCPSSRFPPSTTSTAPTRTRSPMRVAGRTASTARSRRD